MVAFLPFTTSVWSLGSQPAGQDKDQAVSERGAAPL